MDKTDISELNIESLVPHRGRMLLVDKILQNTDDLIVGEKTFSADEFFFDGHYPDNPIVPGVVLCECGVQCGAILVGSMQKLSGTPVLTRLNDVRFKQVVRPGDTIRMEIKFVENVSTAFYLSARIKLDGKTAASFSFAVTMADSK